MIGLPALNIGSSDVSKALLWSGAVAGPLFYAVVIAEAATRPGFDVARHPLSLLSLGDMGWVQSANFAVAGVLAMAGAVGLRRVMAPGPAAFWGPLLVGIFGAGTFLAGCFRPDPALGFPPGAPAGAPVSQSLHSIAHGLSFDFSFLALIVSAFIFARRFSARGRTAYTLFSLAAGLFTPLFIIAGFGMPRIMGIPFFAAGMLAFGWLSATVLEHLEKRGARAPR